MRFLHKVDIYTKTTSENDTGQLIADWTVDVIDVPCSFTPSGAATSIRITPSMEEADVYTVLFPHDIDISYGSRLYNIKDRLTGEIVFEGPFQITQINKHISAISGSVQFLHIKAKTVIE